MSSRVSFFCIYIAHFYCVNSLSQRALCSIITTPSSLRPSHPLMKNLQEKNRETSGWERGDPSPRTDRWAIDAVYRQAKSLQQGVELHSECEVKCESGCWQGGREAIIGKTTLYFVGSFCSFNPTTQFSLSLFPVSVQSSVSQRRDCPWFGVNDYIPGGGDIVNTHANAAADRCHLPLRLHLTTVCRCLLQSHCCQAELRVLLWTSLSFSPQHRH